MSMKGQHVSRIWVDEIHDFPKADNMSGLKKDDRVIITEGEFSGIEGTVAWVAGTSVGVNSRSYRDDRIVQVVHRTACVMPLDTPPPLLTQEEADRWLARFQTVPHFASVEEADAWLEAKNAEEKKAAENAKWTESFEKFQALSEQQKLLMEAKLSAQIHYGVQSKESFIKNVGL